MVPIMYWVYVNDLTGVNIYISLFANDVELLRKIRTFKDCEELHNDISKIYEWSMTWEMEFNAKNGNVVEMGKTTMRPSWTYMLGQNIISIVEEKSLSGNTELITRKKHINKIFGNTFMFLRNIQMVFHLLDKDIMKKIITTIIRPNVLWSPYKKKNVFELASIQ